MPIQKSADTGQLTGTIKVQAPMIHIYAFSRIVGASAGSWERIIKELERREQIVFLYYQPMREAIVKFTAQMGKKREEIYEEMTRQAAGVVHSPNQNPVRDNQNCFHQFESSFLPQIKRFEQSLLRVPQAEGTFFSGIILKGLPHMVVTDKRDRRRYVHLYPSAWKEQELDAYMELLTIVIESEFGADAKDLWSMGLRNGESITRPKSKSRSRRACADAAKHFRRLVAAGVIAA